MKAKEQFTIYVALIDEGTEVYRPVIAEKIDEKTFRIVSKNKDPEDAKNEWYNIEKGISCNQSKTQDRC